MPKQVDIAVTNHGQAITGQGNIHEVLDASIADRETVWSTQLPYRVGVLTHFGWRITTPSIARRYGFDKIRAFPPTDKELYGDPITAFERSGKRRMGA